MAQYVQSGNDYLEFPDSFSTEQIEAAMMQQASAATAPPPAVEEIAPPEAAQIAPVIEQPAEQVYTDPFQSVQAPNRDDVPEPVDPVESDESRPGLIREIEIEPAPELPIPIEDRISDPTWNMDLLDLAKEKFSGAARRTKITDKLEQWQMMPEFADFSALFSYDAGATIIGTLFANSEEEADIVGKSFDGIKVAQDPHGNYLFYSPKADKWFANKPGYGASDVPATLWAVYLAGRTAVKGVLKNVAMGAGTEAFIEAQQKLAGGTFDFDTILFGGAGAGGGELLSQGISAAVGKGVRATGKLGRAVSKIAGDKIPMVKTMQDLLDISRGKKVAEKGTTDASKLMRKAVKSKKAQKKLAEEMVDPSVKKIFDRTEIKAPLDVMQDNPAISRAASIPRSVANSEDEVVFNKLVDEAIDGLDAKMKDLGAATDPNTGKIVVDNVSTDIYSNISKQQSDLIKQYEKIDNRSLKLIGGNTDAAMEHTEDVLLDIVGNLDLDMIKGETKTLWNKVTEGNMNYDKILFFKRAITKAKGSLENPFPGIDNRQLDKIYDALRKDQIEAARTISESVADDLVKANEIWTKKKGLDDIVLDTFGKQLGDGKGVGQLMTKAFTGLASKNPNPKAFFEILPLIKKVPKDLQKEALMTGLAMATRGAKGINRKGKFGLSEFASLYPIIESNKRVFKEVEAILGKETTGYLKDISEIAKRYTFARELPIQTGKPFEAMGKEGFISNVILFPDKIMGRKIVPDLIKRLANTSEKNIEKTGALLRSNAMKDFVDSAANPSDIDKLAKSTPFRIFAKFMGISAPRQWIMQSFRQREDQPKEIK